jgi:hypothetical protein
MKAPTWPTNSIAVMKHTMDISPVRTEMRMRRERMMVVGMRTPVDVIEKYGMSSPHHDRRSSAVMKRGIG